jgi:hypothetical protein
LGAASPASGRPRPSTAWPATLLHAANSTLAGSVLASLTCGQAVLSYITHTSALRSTGSNRNPPTPLGRRCHPGSSRQGVPGEKCSLRIAGPVICRRRSRAGPARTGPARTGPGRLEPGQKPPTRGQDRRTAGCVPECTAGRHPIGAACVPGAPAEACMLQSRFRQDLPVVGPGLAAG